MSDLTEFKLADINMFKKPKEMLKGMKVWRHIKQIVDLEIEIIITKWKLLIKKKRIIH